jgi:hypothetical protein
VDKAAIFVIHELKFELLRNVVLKKYFNLVEQYMYIVHSILRAGVCDC